MEEAQLTQQRIYNQLTQPRAFHSGDRVLILPNAECKFLVTWQDPYTITDWVVPVMYKVQLPESRKGVQIYHVNLIILNGLDPLPFSQHGLRI